jgi:hypothetical protein
MGEAKPNLIISKNSAIKRLCCRVTLPCPQSEGSGQCICSCAESFSSSYENKHDRMGFQGFPTPSLLVLTALMMSLLAGVATPVHSVSNSGSTTFIPSGPSIDNLVMSVFTSASSEYNSFLAHFREVR